jgi:sugar lactone lactonase YvrE
LDALEARKTGRLLEYDPQTKKTRTLLEGLFFANGVAVSEDSSFVLINETFEKRVLRYWLTGEKKGTREVFVQPLPGK